MVKPLDLLWCDVHRGTMLSTPPDGLTETFTSQRQSCLTQWTLTLDPCTTSPKPELNGECGECDVP